MCLCFTFGLLLSRHLLHCTADVRLEGVEYHALSLVEEKGMRFESCFGHLFWCVIPHEGAFTSPHSGDKSAKTLSRYFLEVASDDEDVEGLTIEVRHDISCVVFRVSAS
jgi:hypothetical protein